MNSRNFLDHLRDGVGALIQVAGKNLQHSSETETEFSLRLSVNPVSLESTLSSLILFTDFFKINLDYQIQQGTGKAVLRTEGLFVDNWFEDPDLSPPDIDLSATEIYTNLATQLSRKEKKTSISNLVKDLQQLKEAGALVDVSLSFFINKAELMERFARPNTRMLLYIVTDKFLENLRIIEFQNLGGLLAPHSEYILVIMLGDASGIAEGTNIKVIGRDRWTRLNDLGLDIGKIEAAKINEVLNFRNEECHWEIGIHSLTPYHLFIENISLDNSEILKVLGQLRDRLSVAYLADYLSASDGEINCEFRGLKKVRIALPKLVGEGVCLPIFKLFAWAYENVSSDKLVIVRNIVSLQLEDKLESNYFVLMERAGEILGIAKGNFQILLRRSVELYFDKRLKVSEFLRKFSEEVGNNVSTMTSDLVSDLYKTVGVVLGVVIAVLVDPKQTKFVTWLAASLYMIYIIFILIYLLSATYWRFRNLVHEHRHNVTELRDVLSEEEILRLQGKSYEKARRMFLFFFATSCAIYASLASVAYVIIQLLWNLL